MAFLVESTYKSLPIIGPTIPDEINDFLAKGRQSLLIKGEPGTGKTTLALELLSSNGGKGTYLTDRVTRERLLEDIPWIKGSIPEENIFDTTSIYDRRQGIDLIQAPDEYFKLPDCLKPAIDTALSQDYDMIIFDQWDAMMDRIEAQKKPYERDQWRRPEIEMLLLDTFNDYDVNLIIATDQMGATSLDSAMSGSVTLWEKIDANGRRIREAEITKLLGTPISNSIYLFTLQNARFRAFPPQDTRPLYWRIPEPDQVRLPPTVRDPEPGLVSTCWRGLGQPGESLVKGSINLLEIDECLGVNCINLLMPMALNAVNSGRGAVITGACVSFSSCASYAFNWLKPEHQHRLAVTLVKPTDFNFLLQHIIKSRHNLRGNGPTLCAIGVCALEYEYGLEAFRDELGKYVSALATQQDVDLWVVKSGQVELLDVIRRYAATHWKVEMLGKVLTIFGKAPVTNRYVIQPCVDPGYPSVQAIPIE